MSTRCHWYLGITHARGRREADDCCPGLWICFGRPATVAQARASQQRATSSCVRNDPAERRQIREGQSANGEGTGGGGHGRSFVGASSHNCGLGSKALFGMLLLRTRTATSHSRRIRAGLKLARLSGRSLHGRRGWEKKSSDYVTRHVASSRSESIKRKREQRNLGTI